MNISLTGHVRRVLIKSKSLYGSRCIHISLISPLPCPPFRTPTTASTTSAHLPRSTCAPATAPRRLPYTPSRPTGDGQWGRPTRWPLWGWTLREGGGCQRSGVTRSQRGSTLMRNWGGFSGNGDSSYDLWTMRLSKLYYVCCIMNKDVLIYTLTLIMNMRSVTFFCTHQREYTGWCAPIDTLGKMVNNKSCVVFFWNFLSQIYLHTPWTQFQVIINHCYYQKKYEKIM